MPLSAISRYSRRTVASQRKQMTLEEKAGQTRDIDPLAGQVSGK
jgi:hypothetical protein